MYNKTTFLKVCAATVALTFAATACGGDSSESSAPEATNQTASEAVEAPAVADTEPDTSDATTSTTTSVYERSDATQEVVDGMLDNMDADFTFTMLDATWNAMDDTERTEFCQGIAEVGIEFAANDLTSDGELDRGAATEWLESKSADC